MNAGRGNQSRRADRRSTEWGRAGTGRRYGPGPQPGPTRSQEYQESRKVEPSIGPKIFDMTDAEDEQEAFFNSHGQGSASAAA